MAIICARLQRFHKEPTCGFERCKAYNDLLPYPSDWFSIRIVFEIFGSSHHTLKFVRTSFYLHERTQEDFLEILVRSLGEKDLVHDHKLCQQYSLCRFNFWRVLVAFVFGVDVIHG